MFSDSEGTQHSTKEWAIEKKNEFYLWEKQKKRDEEREKKPIEIIKSNQDVANVARLHQRADFKFRKDFFF